MQANVTNNIIAPIGKAAREEPSNTMAGIMHLALFLSGLSGGGAQRRMITLANAFAARGHRVDLVVVCSEGPFRRDISPRVRLVGLNPWVSQLPWIKRKKSLWVLAGAPGLASYLRRERPEVLLSTSHPANVAALWARRMAGVKTRLVVSANLQLSRSGDKAPGRSPRVRLWQARHFYPWSDAMIAISQGVGDDLARVTGVDREHIRIIYNPIVTPELLQRVREPLDHPWFMPGSPPLVLAVAKLKAQKDYPTLLRAFARVRAARKARLLILGEGGLRGSLEALAKELGITAHMAMPGFVTNPFPYMEGASVFVLSSAWEGFSNVTAEALACGCPVVSTDCPGGGPTEILDHGRYGRLVPVGDDVAMAQAILATLQAPPLAQRLRARAAEYSLERAVDNYLHVLQGQVSLLRFEQRNNQSRLIGIESL